MTSDELYQIKLYIEASLPDGETTKVYMFQRPPTGGSIVLKPASSGQANVKMWSQEFFFSVECLKTTSPEASYNLAGVIRDILLAKSGTLVNSGTRFLGFYAQSIKPEVLDITQNENEVYGFVFSAKYVDNTVPTSD